MPYLIILPGVLIGYFFGAVKVHAGNSSRLENRPAKTVYTFKASYLPLTNLPSFLALGAATSPTGERLGATNFYFTRNHRAWLPFMAEFHYARSPSQEWDFALKKIKAAGVDIVSTYCFWIHHEEVQEEWNWRDERNLRRFIQLCAQNGLLVYLRIGPSCRGEVRNGALPNWVLRKFNPQMVDSSFFEFVRQWYAQLAQQAKGLLFAQGGPIIGIELDNECFENPDYLRKLKQLAVQEGLDVPFYCASAWGAAQIPSSLLPVWRCYSDAQKNNPAITSDSLFISNESCCRGMGSPDAQRGPPWLPHGVPLAAIEVGGGDQTTFRDRQIVEKIDIDALAVTLLGRGANLFGIYMFHGGSNPLGRISPLHQAGYPKISYDFQAPLSEFGQPQPWYHSLRNYSAFLNNFGSLLAPAYPLLPEPSGRKFKDATLLRCALRASPQGSFLFFHNYQRGLASASLGPVQFDILFPTRKLQLPATVIPGDSAGIWPVNLDLQGVRLAWATAQPLYLLEQGETLYCFFKETPGVAPEIALEAQTLSWAESTSGLSVHKIRNTEFLLSRPQPGTNIAVKARSKGGRTIHFVVLTTDQAERSWQAHVWGRNRILISNADFLVWSETAVRAFRAGAPQVALSVFPSEGTNLSFEKQNEGVFRTSLRQTEPVAVSHSVETLTPNRWGISVMREAPEKCADILLRIAYIGNSASLSVRGNTVADNLYNGRIWEISLRRFFSEPLELTVHPLKRTAPISLPQWPAISKPQTQNLTYIEALPLYEFCFN